MGSSGWAQATAAAFDFLKREECAEVAKPEWWNAEGLKALSARVVRAAPDYAPANQMRAIVLSGQHGVLEALPRSAAELMEAATHYERAAALHPAPAVKARLANKAARCRCVAEAMSLAEGPRSAALMEAAAFLEQAAALCPTPAEKAHIAGKAAWCRRQAEGM